MSLIIYTKDINTKQFGIKQIDKVLFKKLMYNEIHKKCRFSIPKEKITKEFGIEFEQSQEPEKKAEELEYQIDDDLLTDQINLELDIDNDQNQNENIDMGRSITCQETYLTNLRNF